MTNTIESIFPAQPTQYDLETRRLFAAQEATEGNIYVAAAFIARPCLALTAEDVTAIAEAHYFRKLGAENTQVQDALTRLVKAKVLRSFKKRDRRYYEVNFDSANF